jgi:hypothetical protein
MAGGKAEKAMGTTKGTANHELADLVGKKIKSIHMQEVDVTGDGSNIRQFYRILCFGADGQEFILALDGGNEDKQYASASLMDPDEFEAFLEDVRSDDSEDGGYDEEDDPFNEDEDEDDDAFNEDEDEDDDAFLEDDGYDEDEDEDM